MHPGTTVAPLPLSPHFTESLAREFYKALGEEEEEEEEEEGSNLPSPLRCALRSEERRVGKECVG